MTHSEYTAFQNGYGAHLSQIFDWVCLTLNQFFFCVLFTFFFFRLNIKTFSCFRPLTVCVFYVHCLRNLKHIRRLYASRVLIHVIFKAKEMQTRAYAPGLFVRVFLIGLCSSRAIITSPCASDWLFQDTRQTVGCINIAALNREVVPPDLVTLFVPLTKLQRKEFVGKIINLVGVDTQKQYYPNYILWTH